jgi:AcrR family transcriptional regulator
MPGQSARERLLDAVIDHFTTVGLGDQSLRHMAEAVGSSHRMLLYHFGSRDGLLLAVAQEVEARTQGELASRVQRAGWATDAMIRDVWAYVADPELGPFERLFFALYGRALQGEASLRPLLEGDVPRWLDLNVAAAREAGIDAAPEAIRVHARLGLAVVRGLLLDLLATGERDDVDAALEVFATRYAGAGADGGFADGRESVAGVSPRASKDP